MLKAKQLKGLFDDFMVTPLDAFRILLDYVHEEKFPKHTILHRAGEVEENSRFLLEGVIGQFAEGRLIRVYFANQITFDRNAYLEGRISQFTFKSLTPVKLLRLSQSDEDRVLDNVPEIMDLSGKLKYMALRADQEWIKLTQMHFSDTYNNLYHKLMKYKLVLSDDQWSSMLGIDARTLRRHKNELHKVRSSIHYRAMSRELFKYPFESKTHDDAHEIESLTLFWAFQTRLLTTSGQRKKFLNEKLSWLSANLYPEAGLRIAAWIAGLFTLLFVMDDYTDQLEKGQKARFWKSLVEGYKPMKEEGKLGVNSENKLLSIIAERLIELKKISSPGAYRNFLGVFEAYLTENLWEATNKDENRVPSIEEYLAKRPVFSGGELALQLIPVTLEFGYPEIHRYWERLEPMVSLASQMIYISNDLLSFDKENSIDDFHNWVRLLMIHEKLSAAQAKEVLIKRHEVILEQFLSKEKELSKSFNPVTRCLFPGMKAIKYQVSGSVNWSVLISKRYSV